MGRCCPFKVEEKNPKGVIFFCPFKKTLQRDSFGNGPEQCLEVQDCTV